MYKKTKKQVLKALVFCWESSKIELLLYYMEADYGKWIDFRVYNQEKTGILWSLSYMISFGLRSERAMEDITGYH